MVLKALVIMSIKAVICLFLCVHSQDCIMAVAIAEDSSMERDKHSENYEKERQVLDFWQDSIKKQRIIARLSNRSTAPAAAASPFAPDGNVIVKKLKEQLKIYENFRINNFQGQKVHVPPEDYGRNLEQLRVQLIDELNKAKQAGIDLSKDSELKESINRFFVGSSASEFSGAFQSKEFVGRDVPILVLEDQLTNDHEDFASLSVVSPKKVSLRATGHGAHVIGIMRQIAPRADYTIHDTSIPEAGLLKRTKLVNASFGHPHNDGTAPTFSEILKYPLLLVNASGNNALALDNPLYEMELFLRNLPDDQLGRLLLIGNLSYGNIPSASSNWPGDLSRLQENFLWTLGSDVLSHSKNNSYARMTGTSMAAPVTTSSLALIAEAHPGFSYAQLKECVLESARQDFYMSTADVLPGWNLTIHVAPGNQSSMRFVGNNVQVEEPYDSAIWGKGILDFSRALIYAALLSKGEQKDKIKAKLNEVEEKEKKAIHNLAIRKEAFSKAQNPQGRGSKNDASLKIEDNFWEVAFSSVGRENLLRWIQRTRIKTLQTACMAKIRQKSVEFLKQMQDDQIKEIFLIALQLRDYSWVTQNLSILTERYSMMSDVGVSDILKVILVDKDPNSLMVLKAFKDFFAMYPDFLPSTIIKVGADNISFLELAACFGMPEKIVEFLEFGAIKNDNQLDAAAKLAKIRGKSGENMRILQEKWFVPSCPELFATVAKGTSQQLEILLKNRNVNAKDQEGNVLLSIALKAENKETASLLIQKNANLNFLTKTDWEAIVSSPDAVEIARIVLTPMFANKSDISEHPLLNLAVDTGKIDLIRLFINEFKVDVNVSSWGGETLLHRAAAHNQLEAFAVLAGEFKADINAKDSSDRTPLDILSAESKVTVQKMIAGKLQSETAISGIH